MKHLYIFTETEIAWLAGLLEGEGYQEIADIMGVSRAMIYVIDTNKNGKVQRIADSVR